MIGEFLDYLRFEKNRSELTVSSYAEDLKAFEAYFKNLDMLLSWETVDADDDMAKKEMTTHLTLRLNVLPSLFCIFYSRSFTLYTPRIVFFISVKSSLILCGRLLPA